MKPSKAYILRIDTPISKEYAKTCADSCDAVGMAWEYFEGFKDISANQAWNSIGLKRKIERNNRVEKAQLCSAGHAAIWKKIYDNKECAVVMEHDGIMLHNIDIDIPDNALVVLGYKLTNIGRYNHQKAGPPKRIESVKGHEGAHAYAITHETARLLLDDIEKKGVVSAVDNMFFLKSRKTNVPIYIMDPTPAIGWLRKSTIWGKSAENNYDFIESFKNNLAPDNSKNINKKK